MFIIFNRDISVSIELPFWLFFFLSLSLYINHTNEQNLVVYRLHCINSCGRWNFHPILIRGKKKYDPMRFSCEKV